MRWDGTIKPPSRQRNRIEQEGKGGPRRREAPQNNCVLYLFHFHPVESLKGGKRREQKIGGTLARGRGGIRTGVREGGRRSKQS